MRILVARDEAFNFVYRANIDYLGKMGDVGFFSPLGDPCLPACDFLYLPGGYPELYAGRLGQNAGMLSGVAAFARAGGRVLAECGGFLYLCRSIDGVGLCGVFPFDATMVGSRLRLGYRQMDIGGVRIRGHEFHYSRIAEGEMEGLASLRIQRDAMGVEVDTPLYHYRNVVAGYTHWYWAETGVDALFGAWR